MEELTKIKVQIKKNIKWEDSRPKGGQHCGIPCKTTLVSEDMSIKISVGFHRSMLKNKELAHTLFELALDELIKK